MTAEEEDEVVVAAEGGKGSLLRHGEEEKRWKQCVEENRVKKWNESFQAEKIQE